MATFAFGAGAEVGRRLDGGAAGHTDIASAVAVADGFDVTPVTLWRWRRSVDEAAPWPPSATNSPPPKPPTPTPT
ncbi:MAG: hypothetical protein JO115_06090 [Pseudonocardiales bacterium]|nr:hypothetical protein [Pseudonocardiales bacterium]